MKNKATAFGYHVKQQKLLLKNLVLPYKKNLFLGFIFLLFTNLNNAILPRLINKCVNFITKEKEIFINFIDIKFNILNINNCLLIIALLATIGVFIRTLSRVLIFDVGRNVEKDCMSILYKHLLIQDDEFYKKYKIGDLMNHLTSDVANIRMMTGFSLLSILNILLLCCISVPLLFLINYKLALVAFTPFIFIIIIAKTLSAKIFKSTKAHQEQLSNLASHLQENLLLFQLVKIFHRQSYEEERFKQTNDDVFASAFLVGKNRIIMNPLMRLCLGISVGFVLIYAIFLIQNNTISLGDFVEFNTRILQLAWPFMSVGFVISSYSRGLASLERINKLLNQQPKVTDGTESINKITSISISNLHLNKDKKPLNLHITSPHKLAIIGPNGSFKSRLLNILCARIKIDNKKILFNEHDINNLKLDSLMQQITFVSENPFLFNTSIRQNLSLGDVIPSEEELINALKIVRLLDEVNNFPYKVDSIIGERGISLSGGQKQRLAIARAIISKKPILIMDDALSATDTISESHIMKELQKLPHIKIMILTIHRLSCIKSMDSIVVLDNGEMVGYGTHDYLLQNCSLYKQLWGAV